MASFGFGLQFFAVFLLLKSAFALRCMNCSSSSVMPLAGCHEHFTEDFIIDCPPDTTYCQVSRYKGADGGLGMILYERMCANDYVEECVMVDNTAYDGVSCVFSCDEDGCNALNVFPNEPEYTAPVVPPTTAEYIAEDYTTWVYTTQQDFPRNLICYNCSSNPEDYSDAGCEENISHDNLVECKPQEGYCIVTKVTYTDSNIASYIRTCSSISLNECQDYEYEGYGELHCHRTCTEDGCNDFMEFSEAENELDEPIEPVMDIREIPVLEKVSDGDASTKTPAFTTTSSATDYRPRATFILILLVFYAIVFVAE